MNREFILLTISLIFVFFAQFIFGLDSNLTNGNFSLFTFLSFFTLALRGINVLKRSYKIATLLILQVINISLLLINPNLKAFGTISILSSPITSLFFIFVATYLYFQKYSQREHIRRFILLLCSSIPLLAIIGIVLKISIISGKVEGSDSGVGTSLYTLLFGAYFLLGFLKFEEKSLRKNYQTHLSSKIFIFMITFFILSIPLHIAGLFYSSNFHPLSVSLFHLFNFFVLAGGVYFIVLKHNSQRLVRYCAWSKRIEFDGEWISPDDYLEKLGFKVTHGISPEQKEALIARYFNDKDLE